MPFARHFVSVFVDTIKYYERSTSVECHAELKERQTESWNERNYHIAHVERIFVDMTIKTTKIDGICFSFVNEAEFAFLYDEIFYGDGYRFTADTTSPFILDCGAHIGMSILYFRHGSNELDSS